MTTGLNKTDVLPCPFCGGEAQHLSRYKTGHYSYLPEEFGCYRCQAYVGTREIWNKRAPHQADRKNEGHEHNLRQIPKVEQAKTDVDPLSGTPDGLVGV